MPTRDSSKPVRKVLAKRYVVKRSGPGDDCYSWGVWDKQEKTWNDTGESKFQCGMRRDSLNKKHAAAQA